MIQGRQLTGLPNNVHRKRAALWRGPLAVLLFGCGPLLAFAAAVEPNRVSGVSHAQTTQAMPLLVQRFLRQNCLLCHSGKGASSGLDLTTAFRPNATTNFNIWIKVYNRVSAGEMPPKGAPQPTAAARKNFLAALSQPLIAAYEARVRREGRATWRRMNRYEYENTLRDLLDAPWLQIKEMLPEDGLSARFNKVGDALDVSHVQMSRYLAAADYALREAMAKRATRPETTTNRYYAREQRSFAGLARREQYEGEQERLVFPILDNEADIPALTRTGPMTVGDTDPAKREREAMGVVASAYEPTQPKFNQFRAPVAGRYKLRLCAHSFWAGPHTEKQWWHPSLTSVSAGRTHEPISLYASLPPQQLRKLGSVDCGPDPTVGELDVELLKGETIMPDAARFFRSRPPGWHNPLAQKDGQPGVAFQWLEVEGPLYDAWPTRGQRLMFGDLPIKAAGKDRMEVVPNDPNADAARLIRGFMQRALRHPVQTEEIQPFIQLFHTALASGANFTDAMIAVYSAVLCSPEFI